MASGITSQISCCVEFRSRQHFPEEPERIFKPLNSDLTACCSNAGSLFTRRLHSTVANLEARSVLVVSKARVSQNVGAHGLSSKFLWKQKISSVRKISRKTRASALPSTDNGAAPEKMTEISESDLGVEELDVVGLGQAMVDFAAMVDDNFLSPLSIPKGSRKVVNHEERGRVLRALDGKSYKVSAGGSLSNTLVALARMGRATPRPSASSNPRSAVSQSSVSAFSGATYELIDDHLNFECGSLCYLEEEFLSHLRFVASHEEGRELRVAMTGSVGSDALGEFYRTKLQKANVQFLSAPIPEGTTGTVVVLTTPEAQRTMLAYMGMSSVVNFDDALRSVMSRARILVIEGYLWEMPETIDAIESACREAKRGGALVALTASDLFCVLNHRERFWDVMCESADILFANAAEALALAGLHESENPGAAAKLLSNFLPLVSVTDGENGSYLAHRGKVAFIPPHPCALLTDTCGAGDSYAAGILYALLRGVEDVQLMGDFAAKVASVVVGQQGARLKECDALELAQSLEEVVARGRKTPGRVHSRGFPLLPPFSVSPNFLNSYNTSSSGWTDVPSMGK